MQKNDYLSCVWTKTTVTGSITVQQSWGKTFFSGSNLIFKELETTFFFLQRTKNYFFLQKKEKLRFFGKKERNSKFLCRSTNYSSFALLVLLLNLFFHNGAGFSETFNHFLDRDWWDFLDDETSEYLYHCYASYLRFQDICKNSNIAFK